MTVDCYEDMQLADQCGRISLVSDSSGERLDVYCANATKYSRAFIQKLIDMQKVSVNLTPQRSNYKLKINDKIEIVLPPPETTDIQPESIPLDIVYEDKDIAVINKVQGMVVHPAPGNRSGTLVNALLSRLDDLSGIGGEIRPGIVHRIDKNTSGLLVVAKNDAAHAALAAQFKTHSARRTYIALVEGNLKADSGTVDAKIGRHHTYRKRMAVVENGREAVTHWRVLKRFGNYTLLSERLETGRTHQIRVHMAYIKHPVAGDDVYSNSRSKSELGLKGQALHAAKLELTHPSTHEHMVFNAPLPDYFRKALYKLNWDGIEDWEV